MPAQLNQANVEHLLRRTEFVARPNRVTELLATGSIAAAVDNVLDVPGDPGSAALDAATNWERSEQLIHFWFDRMAHDSPRPIQEKMAFFWHGHFCTDVSKAGSARLMQEQIDTFRRTGLGNLRTLAKTMSTQVAMIRYLDNNDNRMTSPNQNFGRELMELFLLGVGNYTEADVEASTAAWTGHTDQWDTDQYVWRDDWHDNRSKSLLGATINASGSTEAARRAHGYEVIDTILGSGRVPAAAASVANRGRETRAVAAEFLSRKLWIAFAGTSPSAATIATLRDSALANDFEMRPWVRTLLQLDEFYTAATVSGLVRSPVDYVVALLVASGKRSTQVTPTWLLEGMGQRPLDPPNVSGWKHNGYYVNASAMAARISTAQSFFWRLMDTYWDDTGPQARTIVLPGGSITRDQIVGTTGATAMPPHTLVDTLLSMMRLTASGSTRAALYAYVDSRDRWSRIDVLLLMLLMPDLNVA